MQIFRLMNRIVRMITDFVVAMIGLYYIAHYEDIINIILGILLWAPIVVFVVDEVTMNKASKKFYEEWKKKL